MNRKENFENSQFYLEFVKLEKKINDIDKTVVNVIDKDTLLEYQRLKKIIQSIRGYINLADFDLITQDNFNVLNNHCHFFINIYNELTDISNDRIEYIKRNIIDHYNLLEIKNILLSLIYPSKKVISNVFSDYTDTIKKFLNEVNKEEVVYHKNQINEWYQEISKLKKEIDENQPKINEYNNSITQINQSSKDIKIEIDTEKENIFKEIKELKEKIEESSNKQDELNKFYIKIFGEINKETKEREGGLNSQLEDDLKKFKEYKKEREKEIKGLLDDATSAGLASAFSKEAKSLKYSKWIWTVAFVVSLTITICFSNKIRSDIFPDNISNEIKNEKITNNISLEEPKTTKDIIKFIVKSLTIPFLIWLNIFFVKRRSETDKLYHEYKHKEAFAKSYNSYKNQIKDTGIETELLEKLIDKALDIMGKNPTMTLEKEHDTSLPLKELEKIFKSSLNLENNAK